MRPYRLHIAGMLIAVWGVAGCQSNSPPTVQLNPDECWEAGRVYPESAWDTARAFRREGIPMYLTGKEYPDAQRILVRPDDRERAVSLLRELQHRPIPYMVAPG